MNLKPTTTPQEQVRQLERYCLLLVNSERRRRLGPRHELRWHGGAAIAARRHSLDQLHRHFFGHITPDGIDPAQRLDRAGLSFVATGENIAWRWQSDLHQPGRWEVETLHQDLMNSPSHRRTLLDPHFRYAGIGIAFLDGTIVLTQVFLTVRRTTTRQSRPGKRPYRPRHKGLRNARAPPWALQRTRLSINKSATIDQKKEMNFGQQRSRPTTRP